MSDVAEKIENQPAPTDDFQKIVQDSKEIIRNASDAVKKKDGRGRKPLPRDANGNIIRDGSTEIKSKTETTAAVQNMDVTPMIGQVLKVPFALAAEKTNFEGFQLTDEEAKQPAEAANDVLKLYLPEMDKMDPKILALVIFGVSIGSVAMVKFTAYQQFKNQKKIELQVKREERNAVVNETAKPNDKPTPIKTTDSGLPPKSDIKALDFFNHKSPLANLGLQN